MSNEPTKEEMAFMELKGSIVNLMFEFTDKYGGTNNTLYPMAGHIMVDVLSACLNEAKLQVSGGLNG